VVGGGTASLSQALEGSGCAAPAGEGITAAAPRHPHAPTAWKKNSKQSSVESKAATGTGDREPVADDGRLPSTRRRGVRPLSESHPIAIPRSLPMTVSLSSVRATSSAPKEAGRAPRIEVVVTETTGEVVVHVAGKGCVGQADALAAGLLGLS